MIENKTQGDLQNKFLSSCLTTGIGNALALTNMFVFSGYKLVWGDANSVLHSLHAPLELWMPPGAWVGKHGHASAEHRSSNDRTLVESWQNID